jgi:hypothetical protein
METSQGVKIVLIQRAEAGVRKLLESLQSIEEGDLKAVERACAGNDLCGWARVDGEYLE